MTRGILWGLAASAILALPVYGQGRRGMVAPIVASVSPPGGQVGTVVEWNIAGRGLAKVGRVMASGGGVETVAFAANGDNQAVATVRISNDATPGYRELRLEGPDGVSNLVIVRVDMLPQALEAEPNDEPGQGQMLAIGSSVAGTIRSMDVDHYRIEGKPGDEITLDFEARRVGTSITPVLTALNAKGAAIAQARESRSGDHDCRLGVKIPRGGVVIAMVRDNTYGGNEAATYRLRVTTTPYATGMYPLGGPAGKRLTITALGGNLRKPIAKVFTLPETPGVLVDPGPFDGPDGPVSAPMTLMVGEAKEFREPQAGDLGDPSRAAPDASGGTMPELPYSILVGETSNGVIGRRGEVDRYVMTVKKGEKFRLRVVAEPMGSWLDSVLTVRDKDGNALGENDDSSLNPDMQGRRGVNFLGVAQESSDSLLDFEAPADGPITIEVADRYGEGGPEYGYRLAVGASRPDFAVYVLIGNPNANGQVFTAANNRSVTLAPGVFGVYNLVPGVKVPVNFLVVPQGRPGPVSVRVEGLPEGVSAEAVKVDVLGPGSKGGSLNLVNAPAKAGNVVLDVAGYAMPGVAEFRVVASAEPEPGKSITRTASATIGLEAVTSAVPARPITRRIDRFPLRVVGELRNQLVGPPEEPRLTLVKMPGVLLQGDRIELGLGFDGSPLLDPGFKLEARARGAGLSTNTVIASGPSTPDSDEEAPGDVRVRVLASPTAVPGVYPVSISYAMTGGKWHPTAVVVIVRAPVEVLTRAETIAMKPGGTAELWVALRREVGCLEEVELRVEGLPEGVKLTEPLTLKGGEVEGILKLEMAGSARPSAKLTEVRVVATVRMPRGSVRIEARNRPMIGMQSAER